MSAIVIAMHEKGDCLYAGGAISLDDTWRKVSTAETRGARLEQHVDI